MNDEAGPTSGGEGIPVRPDDGHDSAPQPVVVKTESDEGVRARVGRIPEQLPLLPLRESVVFPGTIMPLRIVRERVHRVLDAALAGSRIVCAVPQRQSETEDPTLDDLYRVGTACAILKLVRPEDGSETIVVHGIARVGLVDIVQETPFAIAVVQPYEEHVESTPELEALVHSVRESARRAIELSPNVPDEAKNVIDEIQTPSGLADFLAANLSLPLVQKQELLETFDVVARLHKVNLAMARQIQVLELSRDIQSQVKDQMDRSQREYYLREQLKAIQQELGQTDLRSGDFQKYGEKIAAAKMPPAVDAEAHRELDRLNIIHQASPEYANTLDYLDWLCTLPWSVSTTDRLDLKRAARILDEDHYGLDKVKKRILEFLAVRKLKRDGRGSILCFVGPPGVGKTSLGQSIARSLDRKFIRMSLGGARDEADIRGHRRTYVGAVPGRILQELRKTGSNNPVFMLDEVDKIGQDFRGDPASALLEVLDPAQNSTFVDHYLDVPFDLSKIMFIATANYLDAIPPPLRDRMEVLELSGYTHREKLQIAKRYLVPRQLEQNGLTSKQAQLGDAALQTLISQYTLEAGVRELDRKIAAVFRARAASHVYGERRSAQITPAGLQKDLGQPIHESEIASEQAVPGVVTGLAFTPAGGEILFVEATRMPGGGQLQLTGQIGEVMRESAQAAFSLARNMAKSWRTDAGTLRKYDYHIHVPAGAVPKDGPSAGVAMITALASAITGRTVDPATGMTGEITLRGAVLPVGGIREKILAAHRAGLRRVLLPQRNLRDLAEIPDDVKQQMDFVPIKTVEGLLRVAFSPSRKRPNAKSAGRKRTKAGPSRNGALRAAVGATRGPKSRRPTIRGNVSVPAKGSKKRRGK